jgi:DNA-binding IclR family transcriptional regulator
LIEEVRKMVAERSRRPGRPQTRPPETTGSRTILVGTALLKTIARLPRPATLSEIGRAGGMSASRTHRYLSSLVQSEFVQYDPRTGTYSLGPASIELGATALAKINAVGIASDAMRDLTEATRLVSHICVWGSNGPTVIRWEQGNLEAAIRIREGINLSLLTTSSGRIFLAYMDPKRIAERLARDVESWNRRAPAAERFTPAKIRTLAQAIRERGLARAIGMSNPRVAALSAPIFERDGLAMSLTLSGIEGSFDTSLDAAPARGLKAAADRVSYRLGGRTGGSTT